MKLLKKKVETKHHWFISNVSYLGNLYKFCLETLKKKKKITHKATLAQSTITLTTTNTSLSKSVLKGQEHQKPSGFLF